MFFVDKFVHSNSLINVQPEENCRIDEWLNLNGWNFDLIGWNSDLLDGIRNWLDGIPIDWTECCQSVYAGKKIGVDWPRPSQFRKKSSMFKCPTRKIGVDRSRESKKGLFSGKCLFKKFLHDWSHKKSWSDKRCSSCFTLRGCVFADVQSREELKMLLQAKRQPG